MTGPGSGPAPRADLRLVPSATAAWSAALVAGAPGGAVIGAVLLAVAALAAAVVARRLASPRTILRVAVPALAVGSAVLAGAWVRGESVTSGVVPDLAADRAVAWVELVVSADPRAVASTGPFGAAGTRWVLQARAELVAARGQRWAVRTPVTVLADDPDWSTLVPSQRVTANVRLAPSDDLERSAALVLVRGPPISANAPNLAQRVADRLRDGLRDAAGRLPPAEAGLLPGLVVGDTSQLPDTVEEDFRRAGLTHLVAVSGANVAIVLGAALLLARWAGVRARGLPVVGLLAVAGFLVLARPEPSVLRATVCGVVAVLGLTTGGGRRGMPALAAAVVVLLLIDPNLGRSYGFALSVLATGGLLLLAPVWRRRWSVRLGLWADLLAVPVAAQVAVAPVLVLLAGEVSLVAVPANLLAAPAVAPATLLGVAVATLAPVAPWLAALVAYLAWVPVAWLVLVAATCARLPAATVDWPDGPRGAALLLVLLVTGIAFARFLRRPQVLLALVVVVAIAVSPWGPRPRWPPTHPVAVFCDVGQGDAVVLPTAPGRAVLVDAGPDPALVDSCLDDLGVSALDAVVLTHQHADHVAGLSGATVGRPVGEIVVGPLDEPPDQAQLVYATAAATRIPVRRAVPGEMRAFGAVSWRVLWPSRVIRGEESAPNNASIVLLVDVDGVRLLLTGDVESAAQAALLPALTELAPPVSVLKVPHHGSRVQDPRLIDVVRPLLAVVSVGRDNPYGHPAVTTMAAYEAAGATVARTDCDGDIAVVVTEDGLAVVGRGVSSSVGAGMVCP